jgi:PDZ domain
MSKNFSQQLTKTLGGVAAMLSAGAVASAQVPAGSVRRDTVATTRVILFQGRTDSINVLAHRIGQERYGSQTWIELTDQLDSMVANVMGAKLRAAQGLTGRIALRNLPVAKGYLGINAQGPMVVITDSGGTQLYRFLAYQPIISVDLGSPADRAGIEPGDVLVGYNGVDLINHEFNFGDMLVPKKRVDVMVRRAGEVKEYGLTVAPTPEEVVRRRMDMDRVRFQMPTGAIVVGGVGDAPRFIGGGDVPFAGPVRGAATVPPARGQSGRATGGRGMVFPAQKFFFISPNGVFGASLSNVSEDLAKALQLPKGLRKGVLVNEVPEDSPAYRGGLRGADVIITADGDTVSTVGQLRDLLITRFGDHSAELQIVRQQKVKKLTLAWPE